MKILFCSYLRYSKELGAAKVTMELAEALEAMGWQCDMMGIPELEARLGSEYRPEAGYSDNLRRYLHRHAGEYEVVDYPYEVLPFARSEFHARTVMVARSVLLLEHFQGLSLPVRGSLRSHAGALLLGRRRRKKFDAVVEQTALTMREADLVNVANSDDRDELVRRGIPSHKIIVVPFGISDARRALFEAISSRVPAQPIVAFVGTFEPRKGAVEFPAIVRRVVAEVPDVRFRLVGTRGMHHTIEAVLGHFPRALRSRLEVIPAFRPEALPELLAPCSLGIFPSRVEGFPFGVLEMLAASLPVIAYNSPGPPMMLTPEYLVPVGDAAALSAKVSALLNNRDQLAQARVWAKQRSGEFTWQGAARQTADFYLQASQQQRSGGVEFPVASS